MLQTLKWFNSPFYIKSIEFINFRHFRHFQTLAISLISFPFSLNHDQPPTAHIASFDQLFSFSQSRMTPIEASLSFEIIWDA